MEDDPICHSQFTAKLARQFASHLGGLALSRFFGHYHGDGNG
jgi:hypothetical protein